MNDIKAKTGAILKETAVLTGAVAIVAAGVYFFSGAEPYIRQQHFRPWHRAVQFCAAALVGHYDAPERCAAHPRVLYLRQRIWRKDRLHQRAAAGISGIV